jgi:hypothetical protein
LTVKSKVTKRPHLKILEKIMSKIAYKLEEKIGSEIGITGIINALKDKAVED